MAPVEAFQAPGHHGDGRGLPVTRPFVILVTLLGAFLLGPGRPVPADAGIQLDLVLAGLDKPVYVTHAHDGTNRLFILEQDGRIKVLLPGATTPTVFLDITALVLSGGERGLLGLAFHPQFAANRRFFVNYTRQPDGATVVAEYRVSATDLNVADTTETVLLLIPQPFANHNGGMIEFGPDGFLYIGMGDGGSARDPGNRAQNINDLLGKILRIDVDHPLSAAVPYSSPSANPFFGAAAGRDEIYAFGFRNPWRFSFDRATGDLYVADVGQNAIEEIDVVTIGGNYGWRVFEGDQCTGADPALCGVGGFIPPITQYAHTGGRCSVTGGYVYRGNASSLPVGAYVYGDFCSGEIFLLEDGVQSLLLQTTLEISSFGEDEAGEIYVVGLQGAVHRIANPDTPVLILDLNQSTFGPGDTLRVALTRRNPGPAFSADLYVGALLPDGMTLIFLTNPMPPTFVASTLLADARTFQPLEANDLVPEGLGLFIEDFVSFTFSGTEPEGPYAVFAAWGRLDAFSDGRFDPGDLHAIAVRSFTFGRAQFSRHRPVRKPLSRSSVKKRAS